MRAPHRQHAGFTLVEMIMVIVITGIIGGMVAMFLRAPIQQYMDVSRRAELTDIADTALYRMASDISTAVPNSVRVAGCGATPCVEFLPTRDAGRYRAGAPGNTLVFDGVDTTFDMMGTANVAAGDQIVIGSTSSTGAMAYAGGLRTVNAVAGATITLNAGLPIVAELSTRRFDVVDGAQNAVTYACTGTLGTLDANQNGQARLVRYANYGINAIQSLPATPTPPVLADRVSGCVIDYAAVNQRMGLLAIRLTLTSGGESVSLYHEIHVNNVP
ncbi:MSHA biogenesis protein MshO [Ferrigenium kumadai]|uniref:MSHA biogenesis protein MshO n=1 Tax=Ferrigenium kumadai TaxID=1682490 RepID=A0AAN1SZN5_9PROT|nr:prepilin-type N-terminal cleavage/methylation domain-containing protein [Ferrigenium kumadai]BBI98649.1 MSHA biogenesis protein MshO [Ferrigenium kumadai]